MSDEIATATLDAPATSAPTAASAATAVTAPSSSDTGPTGATANEAKWLTENLGNNKPATAPAAAPKPPANKPPVQQQAAAPFQANDGAFEDDQFTDPSDELDPPVDEQLDDGDGTATPAALSPDQVKLLSRFKLTPQEFQALPQQTQANLIASFDNHVRYASQIARENAAFKRGAQPPQQQQQRQQPPAGPQQGQPPAAAFSDDHWKPVFEASGEDYAKPLQTAMRADVQQAMTPMQQNVQLHQHLMTDLANRLITDDIEAEFESLELPEGVDKADEQVRQNIMRQAWGLVQSMEGGLSFSKRSLRSAISQAATSLYNQQANQAAAAAKTQQNQQRLRGSPNRTPSRAPTTRPQLTQDQRDRLFLKGQDMGLEGEALQKYVARGGQ